MPEPITTAMIVSAIAAGFAKAITEKSTTVLWEKCKDLLKGDEIITFFPRYGGGSTEMQNELESKLDEKLTADPEARCELEDAFNQLPPQIKYNIMTLNGSGNIGIQDVQGSTINIDK